MSSTHSTVKSTPEPKNDISQGFLTWEQCKELIEWAKPKNTTVAEMVESMIWNRQKYLTEAKSYDDILQDYYRLLKDGKL